MDQTTARHRARELNDSGEYDTVFVAITEAHLHGKWEEESPVWVVVEKTGKTNIRIVER